MNNKSNEKPHINFNDVGRLGSKKNDIKNFIKHLPLDSEIIIEPFAGSFQVIKKVYNDDKYQKIINDNDKDLINLYLDIKKNYKDVENELESLNNLDKKERNKNRKYKTILTCQRLDSRTFKCNYKNLSDILQNIDIRCEDYKTIMDEYKENKDAFIFCDPPYLTSNNTKYKGLNEYDENKNIVDNTKIYIELLEYLKTSKCKIMILLNKNAIIDYIFKDYIKDHYHKIYQVFKKKEHINIICNY